MTDTLSLSTQTIQDIQHASSSIGLKDYFNIAFLFINAAILCATIYVIRKSPSDAIKIGRQLNDAKNKDDAKRELFLTLFSLRGSPLHYDYVRCLNQIDVVFEDTQTVLVAWHTHYDSLQIKGQANEFHIWELQRTNLLSAMAVSLNYKSIRQTDMLKNYYPEGHENQNISNWEFRYDRQEFYKSAKDLNKLLLDIYSNGGLPLPPPKEQV